MSDHTRDWNAKYNDMLKQRLDAEEELRVELEAQMEAARKEAQAEALQKVKTVKEEAAVEIERRREEGERAVMQVGNEFNIPYSIFNIQYSIFHFWRRGRGR